jgi:hypothetical protein
MIDRQLTSIGSDLRDDLGHWIRRKLVKGVEGQGKEATLGLTNSAVPTTVLREEWKMQVAVQLSIRARK